MEKRKNIFCGLLILLLAVMPVLAITIPRFLAFGPSIVGVVFFVLYPLIFKEKPSLLKPVFVMAIAIIVLAAVSSLWAVDPDFALKRTLKISAVLLPGGLLLSVINSIPLDRVGKYLWLIPAFIAVAVILLFLDQNIGEPLYRVIREADDSKRLSHAVYNRATVTAIICLFSSLAIIGNYKRALLWKGLFAASFLPLLYITQSQSAQMSLILGFIFMFAFPYRLKAAWYGLIAAIFTLMIISPFIAIWAFDELAASINALPVMDGAYAGNRMEIWDYVSRYALQNPLYGFGIEATRSIQDFDAHEIYQKGSGILHPHNFVLQLWIEFGIIGVSAGGAFISYVLWYMHRHLTLQQCRIMLPTFIAIMSVGVTGYGMWQGWWLGMLFLTTSFCILAGKSHEGTEE